MFKTSLIAFLSFYISAWLLAAVNTNQWLPPDFSLIPESPRVLVGLLAVYVLLLATCYLIYLSEKMIFALAFKLPKVIVRWVYNGLFLIASFCLAEFAWIGISDLIINSGYYRTYAPQFYFSSGISVAQIDGIFIFTFFVLLITSFFSIRRYKI